MKRTLGPLVILVLAFLAVSLFTQSTLAQEIVQPDAPATTPTATATTSAVRLTMADSPDPVFAGEPIVYTIGVRNLSGKTQSGMTVVGNVPPETQFLEASGGGVFRDDGTVTWAVPTLSAGQLYAVRLVVGTSADLLPGTTISNLAMLTWSCRPLVGSLALCMERAFQTTSVVAGYQPVPTPVCVDEAGNNFEAAAQVVPVLFGPVGFEGEICPARDEDWFKFGVPAFYYLDVRLTQLTGEFDLSLSSPAGPVVVTSAHSGQADEQITYRALSTAGDYRVRVFPRAGQTSGGTYRLSIQLLAPTPTPSRTPTASPTPTVTRTATGTKPPTPTATRTPGSAWPDHREAPGDD